MPTKNKPVLPEYLKDLPDKTLLSVKDMSKIYGYSNGSFIHKLVKSGLIPKPDFILLPSFYNGNRMPSFLWKLPTIKKLIKND